MQAAATFIWRRLHEPGLDSCRLLKGADGWRLAGTAVFLHSGRPCHFHYEVVTDTSWHTREAKVAGYLGTRSVDMQIAGDGKGCWTIANKTRPALAGCLDVDLGFTPATNLVAIRRLALKVGQHADAPAAYLAFPEMRFSVLSQTYHRSGRTSYDYEAPDVGYKGRLAVSALGAVMHYPDLFECISST
jgi:hypothetical protein